MQYTTLGRTGLRVSVAGLGTGGFSRLGLKAGKTEDESARLIHEAFDLGINFIDTADVYSAGLSEEILGRALGADRDEVLAPDFHSRHVLRHCGSCISLGELKGGGHFDALWPWPPEVAAPVAAQQVRGGLPMPGFDATQRVEAQARIVDFHRRALQPQP